MGKNSSYSKMNTIFTTKQDTGITVSVFYRWSIHQNKT